MERAGTFLGGALRRMRRSEAVLAWLTSAWPTVVGSTLAAHTRPVRCGAGCLEIAADGVAWQKQIEAMQHEFCAQVNCSWGGDLVREVKFVTKPGAHISHELDNNHTPFVRRRRG
jgi:predicted nucleic acid-binding Zn ribbon protein